MKLTIPVEMAGLRLDQALARLLPEESRSRLARLIEEGHVRVDGREAAPRLKMKSGEAVEVALAPRPADDAHRPEDITLAVVHEDARDFQLKGEQVHDFEITNPDAWPTGRYKVEVTVDGNVVQSREFAVR